MIKELLALRERLNGIFNEALMEGTLGVGETNSGPFCPPSDLFETESEVVVLIEVPGATAESIELKLAGDHLRIRGEICPGGDCTGGQHLRLERPHGSFFRDFKLPSSAFDGEPSAQLDRGVLTVRLPKMLPRKAEIEISQ